MPDNEELKPVSGPRRRRRGRRGGRGRGRRHHAPLAASATSQAEAGPALSAQPEVVAEGTEKVSPARMPEGSAISQAINEVAQVIEALKRVLDQLEEILELTELAERQKTVDEREIESLRRALRQLQRPGGPRRHSGETEHS